MILSVDTAEPVVLVKHTRALERICYLPFYGFGNLFCNRANSWSDRALLADRA